MLRTLNTLMRCVLFGMSILCLLLLNKHQALSEETQKAPDEILYQAALLSKRPSIWTSTIRSREQLKSAVCYYTATLVNEYQKLPEALPVDKKHWVHAMFSEYRNPSCNILCASDELVKKRMSLVEFAGENAVREIETLLEVAKYRKFPPREPALNKYYEGDRPPFESLKDPKAPWKEAGYSNLPRE